MLKDDANEGLLPQQSYNNKNKSSIISEDKQQGNNKKLRSKRNKEERSAVTYVLKTLNFFVGFSFIGFAIYCYAYGANQQSFDNKSFAYRWFLPAYIGISGVIITLVQCRIGIMIRNMHFFYNYFGRGLFNIYAGCMPLILIDKFQNLTTFQIITIVASSVMCLVGLLYICLKIFCCQKQGEKLDKLNEQD